MSRPTPDRSRTDDKGRTRWELNERIGDRLSRLADYLVIGGYEESHATVYKRLSYTVSRWPESLERLRHEGRLKELPSVGPTIQALLTELVDTGTCAKWEEWKGRVPESVLEVRDIPGLGAKVARTLFLGHGIDGLEALVSVNGLMGEIGRVQDEGESVKPFVFVQAEGGSWEVVHDPR